MAARPTDVKVFEFDELMCIPGCVLGKHSNEVPAIEVQRKAELKAANQASAPLPLARRALPAGARAARRAPLHAAAAAAH